MLRFIPIFATTFFISLHAGALIYINSSYLGQFFSLFEVGLIFSISSLGNIALFLYIPRLLKSFTKHFLFFLTIALTLFSSLFLALLNNPWAISIAFVIYGSVFLINYYILDIFLEEKSKDSSTGELRGIYFTTINLGVVLGPLLLSVIELESSVRPIYLLGSAALVLPLFFSVFFFRSREKSVSGRRLSLPFRSWWHNSDIRRVTFTRLVLESFYGIMMIFTPVYLYQHIGFSWGELGIIFTISLLPFIIFEWPIGKIADKFLGEKEIMSLGLFFMGIALLFMPFIGKVFVAWMAILFLSRVGASFVEITTESYFFKKISSADIGVLSIFRIVRPASIILASSLGALFLNFFSTEKIFFAMAVAVLFGLYQTLFIRDTL